MCCFFATASRKPPVFMESKRLNLRNTLGIPVCGLGLLMGLNIFIFSLPPIGVGIWPQSEGAIAALNICAALCTLGLLIVASGKNTYIVRRFLVHPYVLIPLGIAGLSLILTPFYDLKLRHLIGAAQTGEGIAQWFCWAVFILAALVCFRLKFWRGALTLAALLSFAVSMGLTLAHVYRGFIWTPYSYPDYLALSAFCLIPLLWPYVRRFLSFAAAAGIMFIAVNALLLATQNNIGILYSLLGMGFFTVLWLLRGIDEKRKMKIALPLLAAVPVLVIGGLMGLAALPDDLGFYKFNGSYAMVTVFSRAYLIDTALKPIGENFMMFFTGGGWGSYTEIMTRYLPVDWLDLTKDTQQWDGITVDHFHSHNMIIETLSAIGIFGAALVYFLMVSVPVFAKTRQKFPALLFAGGFVSIGAFWFLMPLNIPFAALGLAACAGTGGKNLRFKIPAFAPAILVLALLVTGTAGFVTGKTALKNNDYIPQQLDVTQAQNNCPMEYEDFGAGGIQISKMLIARMRYMVAENEKLAEDDNPDIRQTIQTELKKMNHLFCQSTIYKTRNKTGLRFKIARLIVRGELLMGLSDHIDEDTRQYYYEGWEQDMRDWLRAAPQRSDQAVLFLLWHFLNGREDIAGDIAGLIYKQNPEDPVGLWFKGLVLTGDPNRAAQGIILMRTALKNGIERFVPVDAALKAQISGSLLPP